MAGPSKTPGSTGRRVRSKRSCRFKPDAPRAVAVIAHPHPLFGGNDGPRVATTLSRVRQSRCGGLAVQFSRVGKRRACMTMAQQTDDRLPLPNCVGVRATVAGRFFLRQAWPRKERLDSGRNGARPPWRFHAHPLAARCHRRQPLARASHPRRKEMTPSPWPNRWPG